jgi:serine beta-lactamase-like protein LACTB
MSARIRPALLALALGLLSASALPAATPDCGFASTPAAQSADRLLQALIEVSGVPGMGAAVWQDGRVVWTGCAGWRDREAQRPVQADTVFRLASVSKVYASTLAARLAEQGRLDLDAPVQTLLPWLAGRWAPLSVRQLAAHASGLAHYTAADQALGQRHFADGRAAVRWFIERPLLAAPGTRYTYSSWGYTLIGAVLEAQGAAPFVELLQQEFGVAVQRDPAGVGEAVSRLYAIDGGEPMRLPGNDTSYTVPGGGLAATPAAVAEFGGRLLAGELVSPATWAAMREPFQLGDGTPAGERDYQVGLGWRVGRDLDGAAIAHHAGVTEGARSALVLWPKEAAAVSLLSNASWVSSIEQSATLLAAPFRPTPAGVPARACPQTAHTYAGRLGDTPIAGRLQFRLEAGRCLGVLEPDPTLAGAFAKATVWPGRQLQIVGLHADSDLGRAALVTPYGLYELRANAPRWQARLPSADLTLTID